LSKRWEDEKWIGWWSSWCASLFTRITKLMSSFQTA
jgi:hypothetical protein